MKKASMLEALYFHRRILLAERGGFEPPIGYEPIHAFQACDLNHSSISPASCGSAARPALPDEGADYSKISQKHTSFCIVRTSQFASHDFRLAGMKTAVR
jgi:hypothetical protein